MTTVKQLKTLSTKDLGYTAKEIRKLVDGKGSEKVFIARIGGVINELIHGESKHGEWTAFKGKFFAVNEKNERFSSDVAFLPANLSKRLVEGWGEGVLQIDLPPADISVVESDKNASGYAFMCDFVLDDASIKKAEMIASTVFNTKLPQLAAPKVAKKSA
jgi:hypothetical protein